MHIHPQAVALARVAGLDHDYIDALLDEFAKRNPSLLVGGYTIDVLIVAADICIQSESPENQGTIVYDNADDYFAAIQRCVTAIYRI